MLSGELARLCLVVLSGYVLNVAYTPPSGSLKLPPTPTMESPWPVWREFLIIRGVATKLGPAQRITYIAATVLEATYILHSLGIQPPSGSMLTQNNTTLFHLPPNLHLLDTTSTGVTLVPDPTLSHLRPLAILALLTGISGCLIRIACFRSLGSGFTFENTTAQRLITTGPYSLVRHPSYLGLWLILVGLPGYHLSNGSWIVESGFLNLQVGKVLVYGWVTIAVAVATLLMMRARHEDVSLRERFGEEWEAWSGRVRYRVIPGVY
ncbi:hypothetical protein PM082_016586 [Marasmius tenuissimus]|nr:hypothetical protein PM082_016586 [Marasmius tenuissimus]